MSYEPTDAALHKGKEMARAIFARRERTGETGDISLSEDMLSAALTVAFDKGSGALVAKNLEIDGLEQRLKAINVVACYVTEEATEERHAGLIEIGKLARGEPCAFTHYTASAGANDAPK